MATMTRGEMAERLDELKRQAHPRASVNGLAGMIDPRGEWESSTMPHLVEANRYLRFWLAPDDDGKNECPCCGWGQFYWGIVHGAGFCSCGWPGRLYHTIADDRDLAYLACDGCGHARGEHAKSPAANGYCPTRDGGWWKPPVIVKFTLLLWAHPYTVRLAPQKVTA